MTGPCGTPCRECPERDECEMECNVDDKAKEEADDGATKKQENICCSSSEDKMKQYTETLISNKSTWLNQPNEMFPECLRFVDSKENSELSKPLVVANGTDYQAPSTWFKPSTLEEMLDLLQEFNGTGGAGCKIVVGNTEVGIGKFHFNLIILLRAVRHESYIQIEATFCFSNRNPIQERGLPTLDFSIRVD